MRLALTAPRFAPRALLVIAGLALFWVAFIYQIGAQWSAYEQYNFGWAVPFLCLYLAFSRRKDRPAPAPERNQLAIVAALLSFLVLLPVRFLHEANPIWRVSTWAWAVCLVGATLASLHLCGGRACLRHFGFPVAFFLVAVPWPTPLESPVIQGLMRANVAVVVEALGLLGIPALAQGNVIELSSGLLGVEEACSGIRSLQATLMLSLFFGDLFRLAVSRRVLLVLIGAVLAFVFNLVRTLLLSIVASKSGISAIASWHDPSGITILVACFLGLWGIAEWLRRGEVLQKATKGTKQVDNGLGENQKSKDWGLEVEVRGQRSGVFGLAAVVLIWFVLVEVATEAWYRAHERHAAKAMAWRIQWPKDNPTLYLRPIPPTVKGLLKFDEGENAIWREGSGPQWQGFYLRWVPGRSVYDRVRVSLTKSHSPEICLKAIGMRLKQELPPVEVNAGDNLTLGFRRYLFDAGGQPIHVFFATVEDMAQGSSPGFLRTSHRERVQAALAGSRNYGQRTLELAVAGTSDVTQAERVFRETLPKLVVVE